MINGLLSGFLWSMDTVVTSAGLSTVSFIFFLPLVCVCIHDFVSVLLLSLYMVYHKKYIEGILHSLGTKYMILAALLGGPVGLVSYTAAVYYMGLGLVGIVTSLYPAVGTALAIIFLKERRQAYQLLALGISLVGIMLLGFSTDSHIVSVGKGMFFAIICILAWGSEAVISTTVLRKYPVHESMVLFVRQTTSMCVTGLAVLSCIALLHTTYQLAGTLFISYIPIASVFGTLSYLFYYRSLKRVGASRTMVLNSSYSAFSIIISYMVLGIVPSLYSIVLGCIIVIGGIISAYDFRERVQ